MLAPVMRYRRSKLISVYFPKRLLLSFLVVLAFPIAWRETPLQAGNSEAVGKPQLCHTSVIGLEARTLSSTRALLPDLLTTAKYLIAYRADTVLPAPDSPLTMMDWFLWFLREKVRGINSVISICHFFLKVSTLHTWPFVYKPPLPPQIYEGPCHPCSGPSRRE